MTSTFYSDDMVQLYHDDAARKLSALRTGSINCCLTSPPYYRQKDYNLGPNQLGLEATVEAYLANLLVILDQVYRVLRDDGSLWIVIADTYSGKGLLQIPDLLIWSFRRRGWVFRQRIIWDKGCAMESATDRARQSHEYVLHFVKQGRYWFDKRAWRTPHTEPFSPERVVRYRMQLLRAPHLDPEQRSRALDKLDRLTREKRSFRMRFTEKSRARHRNSLAPEVTDRVLAQDGVRFICRHPDGALPSSVWRFLAQGDPVHPATFPLELAEGVIAGACPPDGVVLDPFAGSGTTLLAAQKLGRRAIGIERNRDYYDRACTRLQGG